MDLQKYRKQLVYAAQFAVFTAILRPDIDILTLIISSVLMIYSGFVMLYRQRAVDDLVCVGAMIMAVFFISGDVSRFMIGVAFAYLMVCILYDFSLVSKGDK